MKAKIILYLEGDKEAIGGIYFEIIHGHSMEVTYNQYIGRKMIEIKAKVYKTELKEAKSDGS